MLMTLSYGVQSQVGVRGNNEDAAFAGPRLLALADGMGGHAAGELAASLAVENLAPLNTAFNGDILGDLKEAVSRANLAIAERTANDPKVAGMGTTLTAMLFDGRHLALAHVGDSRAYLLREDRLVQITKDDTLVQSLVDQGRLSPDEARHHPRRSTVLQVLTGAPVEPFFELREVDPGDRYLICSDGVSDYAPTDAMHEALRMSDPQRCPQQLIRTALQHGSRDNLTCIVADVVEGPSGYNIAITTGAPGEKASVVPV